VLLANLFLRLTWNAFNCPPNFIHYPHAHPDSRTHTVISDTLYVGFGDTFD